MFKPFMAIPASDAKKVADKIIKEEKKMEEEKKKDMYYVIAKDAWQDLIRNHLYDFITKAIMKGSMSIIYKMEMDKKLCNFIHDKAAENDLDEAKLMHHCLILAKNGLKNSGYATNLAGHWKNEIFICWAQPSDKNVPAFDRI